MREKMHEAYAAERMKSFARAKALYLDAWNEHHPNPRALEDAARVAALAGDPPEARRLRDRALLEAEAAALATAEVTARVHVVHGSPRRVAGAFLLADDGRVVARDPDGDVRVLLDEPGGRTTLSPSGALAMVASSKKPGNAALWDIVSGEHVADVHDFLAWAASPDDARVAVLTGKDEKARRSVLVIDVASGAVRTTLSSTATEFRDYSGLYSPTRPLLFASDGRLLVFDPKAHGYRGWDVDKKAPTSLFVDSPEALAATSQDGRFLSYVGPSYDCPPPLEDRCAPIHVRDLASGKDVASWKGRFLAVSAIAVSPDAKTIATGSARSLRLWDVGQKKQTLERTTSFIGQSSTLGMVAQVVDSADPAEFAFADDGKSVVLAGHGFPIAWDVATGLDHGLANVQAPSTVLRVVLAPGGRSAAVVLDDEVRIVGAAGESRSVCPAKKRLFHPTIPPTTAAYSPSGRWFACAMADGVVHVFDAEAWTERAHAQAARGSAERPVDLAFSADEKTLSVVSDAGVSTYDALTLASPKTVYFRAPGLVLLRRHVRLGDGTVLVQAFGTKAAIFGRDGAYLRAVDLAVSAPAHAADVVSADGKTYAVARGAALDVVDVATGAKRTVALPSPVRRLAASADGKTVVALGADGALSAVTGGTVQSLGRAPADARVWVLGRVIAWLSSPRTITLHLPSGRDVALEVDPGGVVAREPGGAFEVLGRPEVECVAGSTYLARATCQDREKEGVVAAWLRRLSGAP